MGVKIGVIVAAVAGFIGLIYLMSKLSANNAVAKAGTPGVGPMTPINAIPVNLGNVSPGNSLSSILSGTLSFLNGSPSTVSPGVVVPPTTSPEGGANTSSNFVQGPSYSQFLAQQTDAGIVAEGALPLTPVSPSFVSLSTGIDTSAVLAAPDGIMPPGISTDPSNYSGTGDAYYS
jgi:hypothetical protein